MDRSRRSPWPEYANERLKELQGIPEPELRKVFSTIRNTAHRAQPPVDVDAREFRLQDGTYIFVVDIPAGQTGPFQVQGLYKQRASSGNVNMSHVSVVNAVLAANVRSTAYDKFEDTHLGSLTLANNPEATFGFRWACGVELRPLYQAPKSMYDPLDARTESMIGWLRSRGYDQVHRKMNVLAAGLAASRDFELGHEGLIRAIAYGDADDNEKQILLTDVRTFFEALIIDAAGCLDVITPLFTVTISGRLWGVDGKKLKVLWSEESDRSEKRLNITDSTGFFQGAREYRVHELCQGAATEVAHRFCEYVKIHVLAE